MTVSKPKIIPYKIFLLFYIIYIFLNTLDVIGNKLINLYEVTYSANLPANRSN